MQQQLTIILSVAELQALIVDSVNIALDAKAASKDTAPSGQKVLLTRKEAAEILGVSPATIDNYAKAGFLTPQKIGARNVRFRYEQVISKK
ncbi:MAG: helix-turn-helix transcriptional regulator [Daejeonella sp.]